MGPIVAIPFRARVRIRQAAKHRGDGLHGTAAVCERIAWQIIHEVNGTTRVRTIGGWLKRTGRR
jgi:hypothetical protein